jgi:hypothetical protein
MAYANLVASSCINPLETFQKFRNFLCRRASSNGSYNYSTTGIGWTLIDSFYATNEYTVATNDWFVVYSPGEDGLRDLYYKVTLLAGSFTITGYLYWNAVTHVGTQPYGAANTWANTAATNNVLWVYGDLDAFVGISKYASIYYSGRAGWFPGSRFDQTITNYATAITAGNDRVLALASIPSGWAVGVFVFVWDNDNIERVLIKTIAGNNVTITTFVSSYPSGIDMALERTDHVSSHSNSSSTGCLIGHSGAKNHVVAALEISTGNPTLGEALTGLYPIRYVFFGSTTSMVGPMKNAYLNVGFTAETTHEYGGVVYRAFAVVGMSVLIKEV